VGKRTANYQQINDNPDCIGDYHGFNAMSRSVEQEQERKYGKTDPR